MKSQIKRFSKSTISVVLAICMLVSCMTVGLIATDAAQAAEEQVGASATYTVYFRNNGNWSNVYVLTGSNLNMSGSSGAYENLYGSNINGFTAMSLVPGETKVYKATVTVYDNKVAFASVNSTQSGYYASNGQICCVGDMSSGKVVNMWTDNWTSRNGAAYKKYNLEDYSPPTPNITGINGDWSTGDGMTLDSGNNYYYAFNGDSYDKYFRFKFNSKYYEAYANNFDLENGSGGPYDGSSDSKKYGARSGNNNAFKLTASTDYNYRIYFDISGKKTWFTKTERMHSVAIKRQLGSNAATNVSTATIGNITGVNVTANETVTSGGSSYTFDHWAISGGTVSISDTQNGTYTSKAAGTTYSTRNIYVKTASDSAVLTAVYVLNLPPLSAPTNVKLNGSAANCTVSTTTVGAKINLTWNSVTNAGSYKVYKGDTLVTTVTTTSYGIERAASSTGKYTVVAVPSNTSQYSESTKSTGYTLTVNKSRLKTPTLSVTPTAIANGDSVSLTLTDTNSSFTAAQFTYYYYTGSYVTLSNDYVMTPGVAKTLYPTSNTTYMACAYPLNGENNDYYLQSYSASSSQVSVYTPGWYLVGDLVDSTNNKWNNQTNYPVDTYVSANVFKRTVTYENGGTNDKHYFRVYNRSNQYTVTSGTDTDMSTHNTSGTAVTAGTATTNGAMYVTGQGTFNVYVDQSGSSPKVWVVKTALQTYTTTVYVNQDSGATNLYAWKDDNNEVSAWPGELITGTTETVNDIPYYKYIFEGYWDHINMVPNKSNGSVKTADITNVAANATYYITWDGSNGTTASISTTAPVIQLGYKVQNTSSTSHVNFASRSVSVTLGANTTYEFWMKSANTHYNDQGSGTMTRANCTNWTFNTNTTNTKIQTDLAGTYTFTYTVSGSNFVMSVTYPVEPKYAVTINQGDHGTLTVNGSSFTSGKSVQVGSLTTATVQANAASGYHFVGWNTTGGVSAASGYTTSSNPIVIGASAAGTLTATYAEDSYTVTLQSQNTSYGTITTPASHTLTAHPITTTSLSGVTVTPANGYKFNGWMAGTGVTLTGGSSSSASTGSIKATQNSTLTANFTKVSYTLTGQTALNGTVGNYGTVTFYSDALCENQITTAQIGNTVYAKFVSNNYSLNDSLNDFTLVGTGATAGTTTDNVFTFTMGYSATTVTANVRPQSSVTYYVDMHGNSMSGKTVKVAIVGSAGGSPVVSDGNGNPCEATLTQQGDSAVYAATINTPVTETDGSYSPLYIRVTYNGTSYTKTLSGSKVATLVSNHEMWLEAKNDPSTPLNVSYANNPNPAVPSEGYRRIYLAKPYGWQTSEPSWENIGIYHWGNYTDIGWDNGGIKMNYLGNSGSNGYHYYYADIPKAINGNKVCNIIFQGWGTHTSKGEYSKTQTGNIENIPDSANFYYLSKEDGSFVGTKSEEDAVIANYTRYVSSVTMNKTEQTEVNIKPTYTGADVTYTSGDERVVTVDDSGKIAPVGRGTTNITVKIYGTIGESLKNYTGYNEGIDYLTYTVSITVNDPSHLSTGGFEIMSLESQTYTVKVPQIDSSGNPVDSGGTQPGYFDMSNVVMTVEGIKGVTSSTNSAIITQTGTTSVSGVGTVCTAFTVKYAKANSVFTGYSGINVIGKVVTKSIRRDDGDRYGHDHWTPTNYTTSRVISDGIETATTEAIPFNISNTTYSAVFAKYTYVDVTFTFNYYEYNPKKVDSDGNVTAADDGMIQYPYDAVWAGNENTSSANFAASHTLRTVTVQNYEVRGFTADNITTSNLANAAPGAIDVMPENNYYNYTITAAKITKTKTGTYTANAVVNMTQNVKQYKVYVNGLQTKDANNNPLTYTYQEYAEPTVNTASNWYAVDTLATTSTANAPMLASGVNSYKFRVKGNTYLRTVAGSVTDQNFNRSEVDFSHYEVTHQGSSATTMKEYLLQNFYIADFFSPAKVLDPASNNGQGNLPYDDAQFVGGGVVYYSMNGATENNQGTPFANAVSSGYVGNDGKINEAAIKNMLKANIEAQYAKDNIAGAVGENEAMKIAYGTEIAATKNKEGGFNTGIIYRYLPLNQYKRDGNGTLLAPDQDGNYAYDVNTNTFRYSNSLQSYQYVYASGNENKETNTGKNMRLYSYFVYSYTAYNQETNVPETRYEIVISDNYSDASTYWDGQN